MFVSNFLINTWKFRKKVVDVAHLDKLFRKIFFYSNSNLTTRSDIKDQNMNYGSVQTLKAFFLAINKLMW